MTAKLSTGYCLLLLEAIEWFMPLPTDFCQGDGIFYAYFKTNSSPDFLAQKFQVSRDFLIITMYKRRLV